MKSIFVAAATAFALLAGVSAANAAPAFANSSTDLYQGPGTQYQYAGSITKGTPVDANCNGSGWCQISGMGGRLSGWMAENALSFSAPPPQPQPQPQPQPPRPQPQPWPHPQPWPQPQPPRPQPPVYEEAGACFYTERNFNGASFCLDEGDEYSRLPREWNDRIRSVEVFGGARVDLCADNNLYGNCVTLRRDTSRLPSGIDRRVSSLEVY